MGQLRTVLSSSTPPRPLGRRTIPSSGRLDVAEPIDQRAELRLSLRFPVGEVTVANRLAAGYGGRGAAESMRVRRGTSFRAESTKNSMVPSEGSVQPGRDQHLHSGVTWLVSPQPNYYLAFLPGSSTPLEGAGRVFECLKKTPPIRIPSNLQYPPRPLRNVEPNRSRTARAEERRNGLKVN